MISRKSLTLVLVGALCLTGLACSPRDVAEYSCLGTGRNIVVPPASSTTRWPRNGALLPDDTAIDARGAVFDNSTANEYGWRVGVKFHNKVDGLGTRLNLCFVGGLVRSNLDPENTDWDTWHQATAVDVETPSFDLVGGRFFNQGDLVSFGPFARDWRIVGIRVDGIGGAPGGYIHDDCIQNDFMHGGLIDDSKFDGCNVFLSSYAEPGQGLDGSDNTLEIRDTLVRLQPFRKSWNTAAYGENRHGGFFKWGWDPVDGRTPQLYVHHSTFRADAFGAYGGNSNGILALPPDSICHDVTLVNTHLWPPNDVASWTEQCTNLTLATTSTWNSKVSAWNAAHPVL
jgi:hypothetical protein